MQKSGSKPRANRTDQMSSASGGSKTGNRGGGKGATMSNKKGGSGGGGGGDRRGSGGTKHEHHAPLAKPPPPVHSVCNCASELTMKMAELLSHLSLERTPSADASPNFNMTSTKEGMRIGRPAPNFSGTAVIDGDFKDISLADYRGKYLVFFFYPLDFTFVCPTEIIAFSDRVEEFRSIGCEVVACSTDSQFSHLAWVNTPRKKGGLGQMKIPLLADKTMEVAKAYGVLKEEDGVTFRGLFVIDEKGILRQITVNDLPVGRSVDETLRLVQAFQFTDKHGEVCPAGWKPGADTMKPDPKGSQTYFEKSNK